MYHMGITGFLLETHGTTLHQQTRTPACATVAGCTSTIPYISTHHAGHALLPPSVKAKWLSGQPTPTNVVCMLQEAQKDVTAVMRRVMLSASHIYACLRTQKTHLEQHQHISQLLPPASKQHTLRCSRASAFPAASIGCVQTCMHSATPTGITVAPAAAAMA
jgi:hypothetical protein